MARRGLQAALTLLGLVAVVFGSLSVLFGGELVLGAGTVSPSLDSELRYYAAWYVAAGVVALRAARSVETEGRTIRALSAALFTGGCGWVISLIVVGTPHPVSLLLMGPELGLPILLVLWQASLARRRIG
ncbi:MAG: DUF4345 domain-containing protein [Actinomycetota bacterium]